MLLPRECASAVGSGRGCKVGMRPGVECQSGVSAPLPWNICPWSSQAVPQQFRPAALSLRKESSRKVRGLNRQSPLRLSSASPEGVST